MYNLFEEEDPHELDRKCSQIEEILMDLRPQDRMLWDAYQQCNFNLTELAKWLGRGRRSNYAGAVSKGALHAEITRIKKYIYGRMNGTAKRYTVAVVMEFWMEGDTDKVMDHLEKIEGDMIGLFSDYKHALYKKTILK